MHIYLLRHGIAEPVEPGRTDRERGLTPEGRDKLRLVLERARAANARPSLILSSPYQRAFQTAEIAARELGCMSRIERTEALTPDASPYDLWGEIRVHKTEPEILLATHEPLASTLTAFLLNCPGLKVEVKKGALIHLECESFGAQPKCTLRWMLTPATARM